MALATNKRRFYNLLDNLSTPKVNTQTPSAPIDRPSKRTRMPHSVETPSKTGSRPLSTSVRGLTPGSKTTTTRIATNERVDEGSTYAPWSQDQFLGRLETFADVKIWTTKPEPLSDVYWAGRGWTVAGLDEVACRSCGKHMLVRIGLDTDEEKHGESDDDQDWWQEGMEQDYVNKYESLIVDGHTQDCLWRKAGCKDDIYRIKFSDSTQWQSELVDRYNSLLSTPSTLPIDIVNPLETQEAEEDRADLVAVMEYFKRATKPQPKPADVETAESDPKTATQAENPAEADRIKSAAIMSVCGWKAQDFGGVHIASCQKCFARVGLWLYDSSSTSIDDEGMKFDSIALHRTHCPWQNSISQCGLGVYSGHAAWEIIVKLLGLEASRDERRRSVRVEKVAVDQDSDDNQDEEEELPVSRASRDETERQDKERETRLERLKRAFTTKSSSKKGSRPLSSRSTKSFLSGRSFHRRDESR